MSHASDPSSTTPDPRLDREMLADYLRQHLLGSSSGVQMFRSAADTWADTDEGAALHELADQIEQERERLERLIAEIGGTRSLAFRAVGAAAQAGGRLNPVNALRSRRSGWTQTELDLLQGALQGKAAMWHVLEEIADAHPALDPAEMRELYDAAQEQQAEVRRISESTLRDRFLG